MLIGLVRDRKFLSFPPVRTQADSLRRIGNLSDVFVFAKKDSRLGRVAEVTGQARMTEMR